MIIQIDGQVLRTGIRDSYATALNWRSCPSLFLMCCSN